jgi:hypothetical protein
MMAQHFLLSARAHPIAQGIYQAGDDEAYETFCKLRWPEERVTSLPAV